MVSDWLPRHVDRLKLAKHTHNVHMRNNYQKRNELNNMDNSDDMKRTSAPAERPHKKTRVTMYLDPVVLEEFRARAIQRDAGYQTLINEVLHSAIHPEAAPVTVEILRRVLREELSAHCAKRQSADRN